MNVSVPLALIPGWTLNRFVSAAVTTNVMVCEDSAAGPTVMFVAAPVRVKAPESSVTATGCSNSATRARANMVPPLTSKTLVRLGAVAFRVAVPQATSDPSSRTANPPKPVALMATMLVRWSGGVDCSLPL